MACAPVLWANAPPDKAPAATAPSVENLLPPVANRPGVVVDKLKGGLLLPSLQQAAAAVVIALGQRYGASFAVLEDELANTKKMQRMTRSMKLPPQVEEGRKRRLALLAWALKEAPFRVKVSFGHQRKGKGYVASAECRENGTTKVIHRVEGLGRSYEAAVEDLKTHLGSFCGVLDGLVAERKRGGTR